MGRLLTIIGIPVEHFAARVSDEGRRITRTRSSIRVVDIVTYHCCINGKFLILVWARYPHMLLKMVHLLTRAIAVVDTPLRARVT